MNLTIEETKPNCEAVLSGEVDAETIAKEFGRIALDFQKQAKIPGFRPGKAPLAMVEKQYGKAIEEEVLRKNLSKLTAAAKEKFGRHLLRIGDINCKQCTRENGLRFTANVVFEPEFELPDYSEITIPLGEPVVTDEDVNQMLGRLAEQHASYNPVEGRPLASGDFAVVSYESTLDGVALADASPQAPPMLKSRKNMWIEIGGQRFLGGFEEQLVGMSPGETRKFPVTIPPEIGGEELGGKDLEFTVELHQINQRVLPEANDELAAKIHPGKTLEELRVEIRTRLEEAAQSQFETAKRNAVAGAVVDKVQCELPAYAVNTEMRGILEEIVSENQARGIDPQQLASQEEEIMGFARMSAEKNARARFVLLKIAEKEKLRVTEQQLLQHILALSQRMNIPPKKLIADLKKRDAIPRIHEDLLLGAAVGFLVGKATFTAPPAAA